MKRNFAVLVFLFVFFFLPKNWVFADNSALPADKSSRISALLQKEGFSRAEIEKVFNDSRLIVYQDIADLRKKKVDYFSQDFGLFGPTSLTKGKQFLRENLEELSEAEKRFGVSKEIIVAVLRLETNFGSFLGGRPLINTFYSMLVLDFQSDFGEKELVKLFLVNRKKGEEDIFNLKGSFMGAFGLCQFLPSSYLSFAIDGNGDGVVDLFNVEDAIFSVANYFKKHGWSDSFYRKVSALYAYNNSMNYALAVLIYGYELKTN